MALILVIDDEQDVRTMLSMVLTRSGYEVEVAADGEAGLALFMARRAETGLVLLDLSMPKMIGGEVLARIVELEPEMPVVLLTGFADDVQGVDRAAEILYKPYRMNELIDVVRRYLGE